MAEISKLSRLISGANRNISFATNTLVVDNIKLKLGGTGSVSFAGALTSNHTISIPNENVNLGNIGSLNTLSGVIAGSLNLGAFTGSVIQNSRSIKGALQDLESFIENSTGSNFSDSNFAIYDDLDPTKRILFQASNIASDESRTISMPDEDVDLGAISDHEERLVIVEDSATDHETRISLVEDSLSYRKQVIFSSNSAVYGINSRGTVDQSLESRDGWFFKNTSLTESISWALFDEVSSIALSDFSAYAVITLDSITETPYFAVYTEPIGLGDADPTYHSKAVYSLSSPPSISEKYLVYFGNEPTIHPELPRIEMIFDVIRSQGDCSDFENVIKCELSTDTGITYEDLQFIVDRLGLNLLNNKIDFSLRIRQLDSKEKFPINNSSQFTHIDLSRRVVEESILVSIDRLLLHEDDDYTVSVVSSGSELITRITWVGDVAIGGVSAIEIGDNIRVKYRYDL